MPPVGVDAENTTGSSPTPRNSETTEATAAFTFGSGLSTLSPFTSNDPSESTRPEGALTIRPSRVSVMAAFSSALAKRAVRVSSRLAQAVSSRFSTAARSLMIATTPNPESPADGNTTSSISRVNARRNPTRPRGCFVDLAIAALRTFDRHLPAVDSSRVLREPFCAREQAVALLSGYAGWPVLGVAGGTGRAECARR